MPDNLTFAMKEDITRDLNLPAGVIDAWAEIGTVALGRVIRSRRPDGVRVFCLDDIKQAMAAPSRDQNGKLAGVANQALEDASGVKWHTHRSAKNDFGIPSSPSSLKRFRHGTRWLGGQPLRAHAIPVFAAGRWRQVWVYHGGQLAQIKAAMDSGKVADPERGLGWPYPKCKTMGFGCDVLNRWSDPDGRGVPELGGAILDSWYENRLSTHKHITPHRVFSAKQLEAVLDARRKKQVEAAGEQQWLSEKDALEEFADVFHGGDLAAWRQHCRHLGRKLTAKKVSSAWATPDDAGEWRHSRVDLEKIAEVLRKGADAAFTNTKTGAKHIGLRAFMELTGLKEQGIAPYRDRPHQALGRRIDWIKQPHGYIRRNKHKAVYLYSQADAEQIRDWRTRFERLLHAILTNGPALATDIIRLGRDAGYGKDGESLRAARRKIGAGRRKLGECGPMVWYLPGHADRSVQKDPQLPPQFVPAHSDAKAARGRKRDRNVAKLYERCWLICQQRKKQNEAHKPKLEVVMAQINEEFWPGAIKVTGELYKFAARHAERRERAQKRVGTPASKG